MWVGVGVGWGGSGLLTNVRSLCERESGYVLVCVSENSPLVHPLKVCVDLLVTR